MNCSVFASKHAPDPYRPVYRATCLILLIWCGTVVFAQKINGPPSSAAVSEIRVLQILGFEGTKNNTKGKLSIQDNSLQFKKSEGEPAQVSIASIQDVVLGEESKQVGGLPMTLGKAATPYGGGRVISLFSHKKYDTLTLQYVDANGALHGAIFQLDKGQGEALRNQLVAKGAHVNQAENQAGKQSSPEVQSESK
jgi:hypothetical protein